MAATALPPQTCDVLPLQRRHERISHIETVFKDCHTSRRFWGDLGDCSGGRCPSFGIHIVEHRASQFLKGWSASGSGVAQHLGGLAPLVRSEIKQLLDQQARDAGGRGGAICCRLLRLLNRLRGCGRVLPNVRPNRPTHGAPAACPIKTGATRSRQPIYLSGLHMRRLDALESEDPVA